MVTIFKNKFGKFIFFTYLCIEFKKINVMGYQILSPDEFPIDCNVRSYKSPKIALEAYENWKLRFTEQGYYSSVNHGRIPLDELSDYCQIIKV